MSEQNQPDLTVPFPTETPAVKRWADKREEALNSDDVREKLKYSESTDEVKKFLRAHVQNHLKNFSENYNSLRENIVDNIDEKLKQNLHLRRDYPHIINLDPDSYLNKGKILTHVENIMSRIENHYIAHYNKINDDINNFQVRKQRFSLGFVPPEDAKYIVNERFLQSEKLYKQINKNLNKASNPFNLFKGTGRNNGIIHHLQNSHFHQIINHIHELHDHLDGYKKIKEEVDFSFISFLIERRHSDVDNNAGSVGDGYIDKLVVYGHTHNPTAHARISGALDSNQDPSTIHKINFASSGENADSEQISQNTGKPRSDSDKDALTVFLNKARNKRRHDRKRHRQ